MDINSVLGPDWSNQLQRICNIYELFGASDATCTLLTALPGNADGSNEIGVKVLDHLIQQAIGASHTEYDSTDEYDLSTSAAPVYPVYVAGEEMCNKEAVQAILDPITPFSINWIEDRMNSEGDNDAPWVAAA